MAMLAKIVAVAPRVAPRKLLEPEQIARFKARFRAWWEGYQFTPSEMDADPFEEPSEAGEESTSAPSDPLEIGKRSASLWADPRAVVQEYLWGTGFDTPGGQRLVLEMVAPLGLNSKMTVLEIGVGLGGAARAIAAQTGSWVTGLDTSPGVVEAATELSTMAGMAKKTPIQLFDPKKPNFSAFGSFNAAFSKERFLRYLNKETIFAALHGALRESGQFVMTDFLLTSEDDPGDAVEKWLGTEPERPEPWTAAKTQSCLEGLGFEVPIVKDITDEYVSLLRETIETYCKGLDPEQMDKPMAAAVVGEVDLWNRRLEAFASGGLAVYRIYARKYHGMSAKGSD
jgi:cyclopropane fatty-acyl-phospholipid synthase-like methyltransferase